MGSYLCAADVSAKTGNAATANECALNHNPNAVWPAGSEAPFNFWGNAGKNAAGKV